MPQLVVMSLREGHRASCMQQLEQCAEVLPLQAGRTQQPT